MRTTTPSLDQNNNKELTWLDLIKLIYQEAEEEDAEDEEEAEEEEAAAAE